ncbi:uncharacterized protein PgNI_03672 [Pyricularia grisea]|uniref:Uncharacterized protein n=1 Tax=Pyricularia grisea TaxID=148305 RepID=A0A6P8BBW6_PYRGI|nr:uncharacterized protein PgNI_03672 [Pyricularia grisea]TLD13325.1 hypothetical protein PgNI_03672 [Pyricularia grisea]
MAWKDLLDYMQCRAKGTKKEKKQKKEKKKSLTREFCGIGSHYVARGSEEGLSKKDDHQCSGNQTRITSTGTRWSLLDEYALKRVISVYRSKLNHPQPRGRKGERKQQQSYEGKKIIYLIPSIGSRGTPPNSATMHRR